MFHETQYVAAGVDSVAHRHKLVYVWETLLQLVVPPPCSHTPGNTFLSSGSQLAARTNYPPHSLVKTGLYFPEWCWEHVYRFLQSSCVRS